MNQRMRRLWQIAIASLVLAANFSPWMLYWLSSAESDGGGTLVGNYRITLKPRWFYLTDGSSFLGSAFRLEKGNVIFANARGFLLPQTEFLILGPLRRPVDPKALAGLEELRFPWGSAYSYSPPNAGSGKRNFLLEKQGLLLTADSADVLREIESIDVIRADETRRN